MHMEHLKVKVGCFCPRCWEMEWKQNLMYMGSICYLTWSLRIVMKKKLGDNCIQNVHLGWYIVGYMVGNFVLRRRVSGAVKSNFQPYNQWYTSPNENFEYGYPHSNALFNIYSSKAEHFAPNWSFVSNVKQPHQPVTSDVTYDVGTPTVYLRIYWHKFLTLSNQTSHYVRKCIRVISKPLLHIGQYE